MTVRQKMKRTQNKTPEVAQGRDMFQTPNYATQLLVPHLFPFALIWEPAAGMGKIRHTLEASGFPVWASDIRFDPEYTHEQFNFITQDKEGDWIYGIDYIITNPPFSLKRAFYEKCMYYWDKFNIPFALLIPADYSGWVIKACRTGAVKFIPTRRIDYITPSGLDGSTGIHTANFHSMWLTKGVFPPDNRTEIYVELSIEDKKNI